MTTYNTENPVPSSKPQDLFDNAENLDSAMNDQSSPNWTDRLGRARKTYAEIERLADPGTALAAAEQAEEAAQTAIAANRTIFRATRDELLAAMQGPPVQEDETPGRVTNDPDHTDENPVNGDYVWRGGVLVYSDNQPANSSDVDRIGAAVGSKAGQAQVNQTATNGQTLVQADNPDYAPIAAYQDDVLAVGIHKPTGDLYAQYPTNDERIKANVDSRLREPMGTLVIATPEDPDVVAMINDVEDNTLVHLNMRERKLYAYSQPVGSDAPVSSPLAPRITQLWDGVDLAGYSTNGQSLSVGGGNDSPAVSTTQPYQNYTFGAGPRSTKAGSTGFNPGTDTTKPLVEGETLNPETGGPGRSLETTCSTAANYATFLGVSAGLSPDQCRIFASAAGHVSYSITQLNEGSEWIQVWYDQVSEQFARANDLNLSYALAAIQWVQGEADAGMAVSEYMSLLRALYSHMAAYVKSVTGQVYTPAMHIYQTCSQGADRLAGSQQAQLELARRYPDQFRLVTPVYHLPHVSDGLHLTAVGYAWLGYYFGRALADVIYNRTPRDYCIPGQAYIESDNEIRIPVASGYRLELTQTVQDRGFKVLVAGVAAVNPIVSLVNQEVSIKLSSPIGPGDEVIVRYAMDYRAAGSTLRSDSFQGDLRDTSPDVVTIRGQQYGLQTYCAHFTSTAIRKPF